jgi:hypothetical protein
VDISAFPAKCPACHQVLGADVSGCLLCGRFFCGRHLTVRKGVATCSDCLEERLARESSGSVTDADEERLVILVTRDVLATVGPGFEHIVVEEGARIRLFAEAVLEYEQRLIDDVQQRLHDEFVSTTWPTCPLHSNHPLWYSDGWWRCPHAGAIAPLGELTSTNK